MSDTERKTKVCVLGVHLDSEAYPNIRYLLQELRKADWLDLAEINTPMWREGFKEQYGKTRFFMGIFRALYAHLSVITKYLRHKPAPRVYVPYPSVFTVLFLGILPRRFRPELIILDAFISLYDTLVNDRELLSPGNLISVTLKYLETMAYASANLIIVDTPQSASYLCREFNIPKDKVIHNPLFTNESCYQPQPHRSGDAICRVLFIGTFIPLHGIETIISAAARLEGKKNIRFRIVGTGQTAASVENMVNLNNLEWIRTWQTAETLAGLIGDADICLGIFGNSDKTQRVCPLKMYAYTACGRPVVTGDTEWARHAQAEISYKPFETVPVADDAALADSLRKLADSPDYRQQLANNGRRFYEDQLSNKIALTRLEELLYDN